jgi:tripartite-type tricarboxylate transporter receptor subunit TctC
MGSATLAQFDPLKFLWIGSTAEEVSTCLAWHTAPVKTFADLLQHELVIGATGTAGASMLYPQILKAVFGAKFRVVAGYPGSASVSLAMERGEVEGFCSQTFADIKSTHPAWLKDNLVNFFVQLGMHKDKDLPTVPLALDLAANDADRDVIQLIVSPQLFARPFAGPPGIPQDRAEALRDAFNATVQDPDYIADAVKEGLQVSLVRGRTIEEMLARDYQAPPPVIDRVRAAMK